MALNQYLETFFEEKDLPFVSWSVLDSDGNTHHINNEVVIEMIGKAPDSEQEQIAGVIRKIDFHNGDVNDFLKHLAGALVDQYNS